MVKNRGTGGGGGQGLNSTEKGIKKESSGESRTGLKLLLMKPEEVNRRVKTGQFSDCGTAALGHWGLKSLWT